MPLYELFCLMRPGLAKAQVVEIMKKAGGAVYNGGGVVTNVTSYGEKQLAYQVKKAGDKFTEAQVMQLDFVAAPKVIAELDFDLKVDERVLRWNFSKTDHLPRLPTVRQQKKIDYLAAKKAAEIAAAQQQRASRGSSMGGAAGRS